MCSCSEDDFNIKPKSNISFVTQFILEEQHYHLNRIILLAKDGGYFCWNHISTMNSMNCIKAFCNTQILFKTYNEGSSDSDTALMQ